MNIEKSRIRLNLKNDKAMALAVRHARVPLCITDPALPDNPIVFANSAFCDLTGYADDEVIGNNCRMLQGARTTEESIVAIRQVITEQRVDTVEIINYRKDGSSFVNALQIGPILDDNGKLIFYFGSQLDVTSKREMEQQARKLADDELLHRLRNIVNVMAVIIRMTSREENDAQALSAKIGERLAALSDVHFQTLTRFDNQTAGCRELAQTILLAYSPKGSDHFVLSGPDQSLPKGLISAITLCLHELAANSVKHGALGSENGKINLSWSIETKGGNRIVVFRWQESGGPKVTKPDRLSGSKIVSNLILSTGGTISFDWQESGLIVATEFPL